MSLDIIAACITAVHCIRRHGAMDAILLLISMFGRPHPLKVPNHLHCWGVLGELDTLNNVYRHPKPQKVHILVLLVS